MGSRWLMGIVVVVAVVAVGGIGFAAFTSQAYINANATAGTFNLNWNDAGSAPSQSYNTCSAWTSSTTNDSDTLNVVAGNLAPGDGCTFTANLNDGGSLPGNVYDAIQTVTGTDGCSWFFNDNFGDHSAPPTPETPLGPLAISPDSPIAYTAEFGLWADQGNGCQGATLDVTVLVTGTAN